MALIDHFFARAIKRGEFTVIHADGTARSFGAPDPEIDQAVQSVPVGREDAVGHALQATAQDGQRGAQFVRDGRDALAHLAFRSIEGVCCRIVHASELARTARRGMGGDASPRPMRSRPSRPSRTARMTNSLLYDWGV